MSVRIFHIRSDLLLAAFAAAVAETLDLEDLQERDSDNYPGGIYYRGTTGDVTVRICPESDTGWEDFQHWVVLDADFDPDDFEALCEGMILRLLERDFGIGREVGNSDTAITREIFSQSDARLTSRQEEKPVPPE